jgi:hypothetical protein
MKLLPVNKYHLFADKLSDIPFNTLFAKAVLDRYAKGKVFVNNIDSPATFLIAHSYGMSLLFGNINDSDFNKELIKYVLNKNGSRKNIEWLQVYPDDWHNILHQALGDQIIIYDNIINKIDNNAVESFIKLIRKDHIIQWNRINFQYNTAKAEECKINCEFRFINKENYALINGSVIPQHFWKSKTYFLSNGIGFILLNNGEFVSTAFSAFINQDNLEIGVETAGKFRNNGFAKVVCNRLLKYCEDNNYNP